MKSYPNPLTLLSASILAATTALTLLCADSARAQVISWNFDDYGTVNGSSVSYNGVAGVVPVNNWNDSWPSNPTTGLMDSSGTATTLNLDYGPTSYAWSIQGSHPGQDANGTYNKEMLNGYLNAGPAAWNPPVTNSHITLSQIPYAQ